MNETVKRALVIIVACLLTGFSAFAQTENAEQTSDIPRNPFIPLHRPAPAEEIVEPETTIFDSSTPFPEITAVISGASGTLAMIDREIRREGDTVNGWTITALSPESVTVTQGDYSHAINLATDDAEEATRP